MEANELVYAKGVLLRLAQAARSDLALAQQVRELVLRTGILDIFGLGDTMNPFDILDAGGEELLRARLSTQSMSELKQIIAARAFDPDKATGRWRSPARFIDLIVTRALDQWQQMSLARVAAAPTMRMTNPIALPELDTTARDGHGDADEQLHRIASAAAWML